MSCTLCCVLHHWTQTAAGSIMLSRRRIMVKALLVMAVMTTVYITATFIAGEQPGYLHNYQPYRLVGDQILPVVRDVWQEVPRSVDKFYVYSAFFERRGAFKLRVVGVTNRVHVEAAWCVLWYSDDPTILVRAKIQIIREHHYMPYSACFIFCPMEDTFPVPESVSIVGDPKAILTNRLAVIDNNPVKLQEPKHLAACIKPLYNYTNILELIEFVEMYRLLGVDHVVIYHDTISPQVRCALDEYADAGDVTMRYWQLDMVSDVEIRTEGIFAALNDCLYRYMYRYSNLIVVDLDEYIVPQKLDTLTQLVENLDLENDSKKSVGSYIFKNAFFFLNWPQSPSSVDQSDPWISALYTTGKLRRKLQLENFYTRSKYIFKPERVVEAGNHFVWEYLSGVHEVRVPPWVGLSHHYRYYCEWKDCRSRTSVKEDTTALRFKDKLLTQVKEKWEAMKERCSFPNISKIAKKRWVNV